MGEFLFIGDLYLSDHAMGVWGANLMVTAGWNSRLSVPISLSSPRRRPSADTVSWGTAL